MANTLNLGTDGNWAVKKDSLLAYNSENNNFKPLPFDFSRASSATRVSKDGLIETVGSGEPRIDYKDDSEGALLLEPQRTNLIPYSEDTSNWSTQSSSVLTASNQAISPDGTLNADKLIPANGSVTSNGGRYVSFSSTAGTDYSVSVFVKQAEYRYVTFSYGSTAAYGFHFDLQDGVIIQELSNTQYTTISREVESFSNGWYRIKISLTDTLSVASRFISVRPANEEPTATNNNYATTGDGASGIYAWGLQIEEQSYPTSYIPTSGSTVTRIADSCSQTPPDGVIGQTEGTVFVDFIRKPQSNNTSGLFGISSSNNADRVVIWNNFSLNSLGLQIKVNGGNLIGNQSLGNFDNDENYKIAISYKSGEIKAYVNGSSILNFTNSFTFANDINTIIVNSYQVGVNSELSPFKDLKLYNTALTDQELIALTTI